MNSCMGKAWSCCAWIAGGFGVMLSSLAAMMALASGRPFHHSEPPRDVRLRSYASVVWHSRAPSVRL